MSQSCTSVPSAVPPLNLDDINDMEIYDTDDPRRDVSLGYLGIGSRQSHYIEVTHGAISIEQNMRFGLIVGRLAKLKKKRLGRKVCYF
jgi:hypothetical protein